MKFILGKKVKMSQCFKESGEVVPVTVIKAGPCVVTQIKTKKRDGYEAVQVGFEQSRKLSLPQKGHLKKLGNFKYLREFKDKNLDLEKYKVGDKIDLSAFRPKNRIQISSISKGKGFQGVVKRHGFKGGPASHGHKDQLRAPGSIGATDPQRVFKGMKMAGRMGKKRVTVKNLEIVEINTEKNLLLIKGAVPGDKNALLEIKGK